jgi:glutamate carboxypeptidase
VSAAASRYLDRLAALAGLDSPTGDRAGTDACARLLAHWLEVDGAASTLIPTAVGLDVHGVVGDPAAPRRIVLMGHHDTVFTRGVASERPVRRGGDRAFGPGVADMKGGLLVALEAIRVLQAEPALLGGRVEFWSVPDEESRPTPAARLDDYLEGVVAALVFECGRPGGEIVSRRSAGTWLRLDAVGRPAHAGTQRADGRSALAALAAEALRIERVVHAARPGLSATVTEFTAGTGPNTVPAHARATVDLRASTDADLAWAVARVEAFDAHDGVEVWSDHATGFPAMERSDALVERTLACLARYGADAGEATAGGVSDASWFSARGVAAVDGLGPVGADDHTPDEWIALGSVPPRVAAVVDLCRELLPPPG